MEIEHIVGQANIPRAVQALTSILPPSSLTGSQQQSLPPRYISAAGGGCLVVNDAFGGRGGGRGNNSNNAQQQCRQTFLQAIDGPLSSLRVSRSGKFIISGHCGKKADVVVWSAESLQLLLTLHEHERAVVDCDMVDDDSILVSLGAEKRLCFTDMSNAALVAQLPLYQQQSLIPLPDFMGSTAAPNCPYTTILVAGPRVQDVKRRQLGLFHTAIVTQQSIFFFHLDPYHGKVNLAIQPAQMRTQLASFQKVFSAAQFTAFGDLFVVGTESGEVGLFNTENGALLQTVRVCTLGVRSLSVLSSGDGGIPFSSAPANNNNSYNDNNNRYANLGPAALRSSTIYVAGGDGSIATVKLSNQQQVNQLTVAEKTSIAEPIATLTILETREVASSQQQQNNNNNTVNNFGGSSRNNNAGRFGGNSTNTNNVNTGNNAGASATSTTVATTLLAQAISGAVYIVDCTVGDTQAKQPEYDMHNKRAANGNMSTFGGPSGDPWGGATNTQYNNRHANNQFRNQQNLAMNTTLGGGGGGGGGGALSPSSLSSPSSSNVTKLSDAARSPYTAVTAHPRDPTRFFTASAGDGLIREWDLATYLCRGVFGGGGGGNIGGGGGAVGGVTSVVGGGGKGVSANATFYNSHNPSGRGFIAGGGGAFGANGVSTAQNNAIGYGSPTGPAGAAGFTIGGGAAGGAVCTMLQIGEALDLLFSSWSDGSVRCHDMTSYQLVWVLPQAHKCPVTSLVLTNALKYFVTGAADGEIRLWDTKTREMRGSVVAHQQAVIHLEFFDADYSGGNVPQQQQQSSQQQQQQQYQQQAPLPPMYGRRGQQQQQQQQLYNQPPQQQFGGTGGGGAAFGRRSSGNAFNNSYNNNNMSSYPSASLPNSNNTTSAAAAASSQFLLSASKDRTVCTWEISAAFNSLRRQTCHQTHVGPLTGCKLMKKTAVNAHNNNNAMLNTFNNNSTNNGYPMPSASSSSSSTSTHFMTIAADRQLHLCDLRVSNPNTNTTASAVTAAVPFNSLPIDLMQSVTPSSFNRNNSDPNSLPPFILAKLKASLMNNNPNDAFVASAAAPFPHPTCFAFTNDERFVVVGGSDATVRMWDLSGGGGGGGGGSGNGIPLTPHPLSLGAAGHTDSIAAVAFTCDGRQIVTCGQDGSLIVWNNRYAPQ